MLFLTFIEDGVRGGEITGDKTLDSLKESHRIARKSLLLCADVLSEDHLRGELQLHNWKEVHWKSLFYRPLQILRLHL